MEVLTAHIGDSRAYLLRGGKLTQLTHDHSAVQRMVDEQLISPEAAKTHPDLNVLTRALGKQAEIAIEVGPRLPLYPGDTILLCTDGLWGHVSDEQMAYELSVDRSASETADALVQLALDRGSDDNITLQILRLEDRNAAGRPFSASAAAVAAPAVTLLELQRGRGVPMSAPAAAAPAMRVEIGGPPRKKSPYVLYALLIAAFVFLAAGVAFVRRFEKTIVKQTKPGVADQKPCPDGKSRGPGGCPEGPNASPIEHEPGPNACPEAAA